MYRRRYYFSGTIKKNKKHYAFYSFFDIIQALRKKERIKRE